MPNLDQLLSVSTHDITPRFWSPMYREVPPDYVIPGIAGLPYNSVTLLETNPSFVASFMIGLNHEMSRELQWREFPARLDGTYFMQFWGNFSKPEEHHPHIFDIAAWAGTVNPPSTFDTVLVEAALKPRAALVLKGDLLRRYPRTMVLLAKDELSTDLTKPVFFGSLPEHATTFFVYEYTVDDLRHSDQYFVIQQPPTEPRFGFDEARPATQANPPSPKDWLDMSWKEMEAGVNPLNGYLENSVAATPVDPAGITWNMESLNAADAAYAMRQPSFRLLIKAQDLIEGV